MSNFNDYLSKGISLFQEGKIGPALENLEAALKLQPNNVDLQQMVTMIKAQANTGSKAAQALVDEAKHRVEVMNALYGVKLGDLQDVDKIITEYSRDPNHPSAKDVLASAYYIRGLLFDSKGEHALAAKDYSEAIKNQPDYPLAFNKRGLANLETGNYEQAIEDFKNANLDSAQLKQRLSGVYMKRAIQYDKKGEYANAAGDFAKVLEFDPANNTARELLAMAKAQAPQGAGD